MTSNPNAGYYNPSNGSLTGFSSVSLPTDTPNLPKYGWSIEQLRAFLTNESGANFPTEDQMRQINTLINSHLNDFNNPHHVTLDQLDHNFVLEILGNVTPGTPPDNPPFFSFDSICTLPLGDVYPATYSSTGFYRMTESGVFIDPSTEVETVGTDYITGTPGVPLFSPVTNYIPTTWKNTSNLLNTVMALATARPGFPFNFYTLSETNASGTFGISIQITESLSTVYTLTLFLVPIVTGGSVIFSQPSAPANTMTVNLSTGAYTFSSAAVSGETFVYPSGVIRVSFTFTSGNPSSDNAVKIVHLNPGDTTPVRAGQASRALFLLGYPLATQSTLNQPVLISPSTAGSTSVMALGFNKVPTPASMGNLMMTMAFNMYPMLPGATIADTKLLTFDALTIERDQVNIYVKMSGSTVFTTAILPGLNVISLSYSATTMIFKDLLNARQTATGVYPLLSTANVTVGPCAGYLQSLAFYAKPDTTQCLEYLTNG